MATACILLLQIGLMMSVGFTRVKHGQGIGDGGHHDLELRIRRHANLAENGAIFLLALALLESIGGNPTAVMILAAGFVVARVSHAVGLTLGTGPNAPRFIGAMGTMALGLTTGCTLLYVAGTTAW